MQKDSTITIAARARYPLSIRIKTGNPYGVPIGKVFPFARIKEGNGSPYPVEVLSFFGDWRLYQFKIEEIEVIKQHS